LVSSTAERIEGSAAAETLAMASHSSRASGGSTVGRIAAL